MKPQNCLYSSKDALLKAVTNLLIIQGLQEEWGCSRIQVSGLGQGICYMVGSLRSMAGRRWSSRVTSRGAVYRGEVMIRKLSRACGGEELSIVALCHCRQGQLAGPIHPPITPLKVGS